ncbi:MAG: hypothetical protein HQK53_04260 [Oligoflexia bacterium]|nr:hypothetical protein [Oligoflexia bacterium]
MMPEYSMQRTKLLKGIIEIEKKVAAFVDKFLIINDLTSELLAALRTNGQLFTVGAEKDRKKTLVTSYISAFFVLVISIWFPLLINRSIYRSMGEIIDEISRLVHAILEGKLNTRGEKDKIYFEFRSIVEAFIGPINVTAECIDKLSKGNVPSKITDNYNGDFNIIKNNLNKCIHVVNGLVQDTIILSKAAIDGKLITRADAKKHEGDHAKIKTNINNAAENLYNALTQGTESVGELQLKCNEC